VVRHHGSCVSSCEFLGEEWPQKGAEGAKMEEWATEVRGFYDRIMGLEEDARLQDARRKRREEI
jgi:hypothetical protein